MKVKLPTGMPRTVAEMRPSASNAQHFQIALRMAQHGDPAQRKYARAWFGHARRMLKPFRAEPVLS